MAKVISGVDWVELNEPSNNHTIYISLSTGVTSEKKPLNVEIKNAYDFEWWELLDTKSNRFYYFNTRNKQTTWIKPKSSSIIQFGNVQIPVDDLAEKLESQCTLGDNSLQTDILLDPQGGLSSTPSVKHRPFPRTNPRSVPRRGGGADSPITQSLNATNRNSAITESIDESVRRRLGHNSQNMDEQSSQGPGDKMLSSQQRCQSRGSLSSSGTEPTMHTMGIMSAQGQSGRLARTVATDIQGQNDLFSQELSIETSMNMNNGSGHQGMSLPNTMNGYPVYDYPPASNSTYYMANQNNFMAVQQQGTSGRIISPSSMSQPEAFCLRRPQSEQAIGADINKQRITMISPRSDIIAGIGQSSRYYPNTNTGWIDRSFSPPPFARVFPQYPGPLPGWNSELFRKDQVPAKLLNWSKESLHKPLLMSTDKILKSDACQSFKQIQGYMGDRKSKHSPTELVNSIIQKGANYYPLRDEIFMQICKQTTNNPDELSILRGWELLRTCLNYFAPSAMFRPYLEGYVLRHLDNSQNNECPTPPKIQQAAEQTLQFLSRIQNSASRFDPTLQYQYQQQQLQLQQQQQQQQQMMMMAANMQTVSNHKNHQPVHLFESTDNSDDCANQRSLPLSSHFGYTLDEIMRAQYLKFPDRELPWILVTLCDEIFRRKGDRTEGIFRTDADPSAVQALCTVLDLCESVSDHPLTCNDLSPHTPACSLKRWLESLLEPLVPPSLCMASPNSGNRVRSPMEVYQCLSRLHQATLMYLIRFLQQLSLDDNTRLNRMGPWNLAVALAPHVFQLDPSSGDIQGARPSKRVTGGGGNGLDTCRSDNSTNDSSGSSSRGGGPEDSFRPHINFLYQLIVGLDTSPLDGVS